jgi:ABC-2 type transport system ATP-binding protein
VTRLLDEVGIGAERRMQLRKFSKGMIQRVGIAQALINEPEVIFFDEPMSGLDPLGRREVRQLMLRLRGEGRTIFFSSHILADAEALCTRVAILAGGRLRAIVPVDQMLEFGVHGWELVVAGLSPATWQAFGPEVRRITQISEGRYSLELSAEAAVDRVLASVVGGGATLVSLNPMRETLEDVFMRHVGQAGPPPGRAPIARGTP